MPFKAHFYRQILLKSQPFWAAPRPGAFRGLALKKIPGIMFFRGISSPTISCRTMAHARTAAAGEMV